MPTDPPQDDHLARAIAILERSPLIDGHNDLAIALRTRVGGIGVSSIDLRAPVEGLDTDIPRLSDGRVGGQFWSIWVSADLPEHEALPMALEQLDIAEGFATRYPDVFERATTADEVEHAFAGGRIASLLGLEGGSMIASSLPILRTFFARGVRYMTLTHWRTTRWADAATDEPRHGGLTAFGREVVREMNRLGMLVDLSHVAPSTMAAALDVDGGARGLLALGRVRASTRIRATSPTRSSAGSRPMAASLWPCSSRNSSPTRSGRRHSRAWISRRPTSATTPTRLRREVRDVRRAWLAANPPPSATLEQLADHVDHLVQVMGVEHVGIGSDFDGGEFMPIGMEDVSRFPYLLAELLRRGYSDDDVRAIAGGNILRVMRGAEATARRLQAERPPSEATIEELDGS